MSAFEEQDYTKQFSADVWKKLFGFVKKRKGLAIAAVAINAILAAFMIVGALYTKYAIDTFVIAGEMETFNLFVGIYMATIVVEVILIFLFIAISGKLEVWLTYDIRKAGFKKLQELSFSYYDTTPVGWIMARMTSDAYKTSDVIAWSFSEIIWAGVVIILAGIVMFVIDPMLMLITFCTVPFLAITSLYFQKRILHGFRNVKKINSKITGAFNEGINGARTTKTLVREERNFEEFSELTGSMRDASVKTAVLSSLYRPTVLFICNIAVAMVLWSGGNGVMLGEVGYGTLALFITYAMQIFEPIKTLADKLSDILSSQASAERIMSLLNTESDIVDSEKVVEKYGDTLDPKTENWEDMTGNITFDAVDFSYKTGEKVLENFCLEVKAGERIALVGETGSGKSTIVNLLCRFYEPTKGTIFIDGVDARERSQLWLQSHLGYVLQTPHLFSGSIKDNIRYAKLDATDEQIIEATKIVNAYEFIMKLEKGFDTEVGEGGSRLSSGEKQLISFARAILADPKLFILDEATSSIDTETEQVIQKAIEKVLSGRTSFIVAHRLSTIRNCDKIILIHKGEIAEMGSHKQLIKQKGAYYQLYTNQFKTEKEDAILGRV